MRFFTRATLAAVAVLGLAACGDDDDNGTGPGDALDATFQLTAVSGVELPAGFETDEGVAITFEQGSVDLDDDNTYSLSLSGTVDETPTTLTSSGTYELDLDDDLIIFDRESGTLPTVTFDGELDGDNLTIVDEDLGVTYQLER